MENHDEDVHAENGWTTLQNGVDAAYRTCYTKHKTDGYGRN
jgi:hypothetical protein